MIAVATGVEQIVGAVITAIAASFIGVGLLRRQLPTVPVARSFDERSGEGFERSSWEWRCHGQLGKVVPCRVKRVLLGGRYVTLGTRISRHAIAAPIGAVRYEHAAHVRTGQIRRRWRVGLRGVARGLSTSITVAANWPGVGLAGSCTARTPLAHAVVARACTASVLTVRVAAITTLGAGTR
jgi:hypothetical protein